MSGIQLPNEVLLKILCYINKNSDLFNCRLVNENWNIMAQIALQPICPKVYFQPKHDTDPNPLPPVPPRTANFYSKIKQFPSAFALEQFLKFRGSHVEQLTCRIKWLDPGSSEFHMDQLEGVVSQFASMPNLKLLKLRIHTYLFGEGRSFSLASLLQKTLVNLKKLEITYESEILWLVPFLMALRQHAPNIQNVKLIQFSLKKTPLLLGIFKGVPYLDIRSKALDTSEENCVKVMELQKIPVHRLEIEISIGSENLEVAKSFARWLSRSANTLKMLKLNLTGRSTWRLTIPTLGVLTSLQIDFADCQGILVLGNLPNLKHLGAQSYVEGRLIFYGVLKNVETLEFRGYAEKPTYRFKKRWDQNLPSVTTLRLLEVEETQIHTIGHFIQNMRRVKHLTIMTKASSNIGNHRLLEVPLPLDTQLSCPSLARITGLETLETNFFPLAQVVYKFSLARLLKPYKRLHFRDIVVTDHQRDALSCCHDKVEITFTN